MKYLQVRQPLFSANLISINRLESAQPWHTCSIDVCSSDPIHFWGFWKPYNMLIAGKGGKVMHLIPPGGQINTTFSDGIHHHFSKPGTTNFLVRGTSTFWKVFCTQSSNPEVRTWWKQVGTLFHNPRWLGCSGVSCEWRRDVWCQQRSYADVRYGP